MGTGVGFDSFNSFSLSTKIEDIKRILDPLCILRGHQSAPYISSDIISLSGCQSRNSLVHVSNEKKKINENDSSLIIITGDVFGNLCTWSLNSLKLLSSWQSTCKPGSGVSNGILAIFQIKNDGKKSTILVQNRSGTLFLHSIDSMGNFGDMHILLHGSSTNSTFCRMSTVKITDDDSYVLACDSKLDLNPTLFKISIDSDIHIQTLICSIGSDRESGIVTVTKLLYLTPDQLIAVLGFDDGSIVINLLDPNYRNYKFAKRIKAFNMTVTCLDVSIEHDRLKLVAGGPNTDIIVIDNLDIFDKSSIESAIRTIVPHEGFSEILSIQPDIIVTGGWDGKIRLFKDLILKATINTHTDSINSITKIHTDKPIRDRRRPLVTHTNIIVTTSKDLTVSLTSLDNINSSGVI